MQKEKFSLNSIVTVGVMAAIIFVISYFIRIPIPTPVGETQLKLANAFCLLAGILFGGVKGGLAAGIGSVIFDLLNPKYITSAPFTLLFFFLMAFICGIIANIKKEDGEQKFIFVLLGTIVGALSYTFLYITKSVITLVISGSDFTAAVVACAPKLITSLINAVIAIILANILAPILKKALKKVKFL